MAGGSRKGLLDILGRGFSVVVEEDGAGPGETARLKGLLEEKFMAPELGEGARGGAAEWWTSVSNVDQVFWLLLRGVGV